jgi:hypothetical protein
MGMKIAICIPCRGKVWKDEAMSVHIAACAPPGATAAAVFSALSMVHWIVVLTILQQVGLN